MDTTYIKTNSLAEWFRKITAAGQQIAAPKKIKDGQVAFAAIADAAEIDWDHVQTVSSAKEYLFPAVEEMFSFRKQDGHITMLERQNQTTPNVLFGLRPCDAASLAALNAVFTWDYQDNLFLQRLQNTTMVSVSCAKADEYCFCTAVGGGPGDTRGSDILLTPVQGDGWLVEVLSDKGKRLVAAAPDLFATPAGAVKKEDHLAKVAVPFNVDDVRAKITPQFYSDELWLAQSLRCLGCGACAYVCPTCTCFDIQDETYGQTGTRLRCWDSCGFGLFTLHTSGHNPRETQNQRWRQRLMHKFSYGPERVNALGCVGCGRCSRACPVDMNILEHVKMIAETKS
jgi:sulfhydrogenase subunit beta (sulfur reductase)